MGRLTTTVQIPETDLVVLAEREVIEKAKAWVRRMKEEREYPVPFMYRECDDLFAAVTLLESREAVSAEIIRRGEKLAAHSSR